MRTEIVRQYLRYLGVAIVAFMTLVTLSACDKECACLTHDACGYCADHHCGCPCCQHDEYHNLVVQGVYPSGHGAASHTLEYGTVRRLFYGDHISVTLKDDYADLLMYNNDGETTNITDEGIAYTNLVYGSDSLRNQPSPFYSLYQPHTYVHDVDTIYMSLQQRVFDYDIEVELSNNDGRVASVTAIIISGMAQSFDMKSGVLSGSAIYSVSLVRRDSLVTGHIQSFGPGVGPHTLYLQYRRADGGRGCHAIDITDLARPLEHGGTIHVIVDVTGDIPYTPPTTASTPSMDVSYEDWQDTSFDIVL